MNLKTTIQAFATAIGMQFSYKGKYEHNADGDDLDYSGAGRVNLFEIEQFGFKKSGFGGLRDRFPVFIEFVKQVPPNMKADEREEVIEAMRLKSAEFITTLEASGLFEELPETISGVVVIDRYDVNVAGVELNLTLIANEPMSICV